MTLVKVLTWVFAILSLVLAAYLTFQIREKILEESRIQRIENAVKEKLTLIRDVQVAYEATYGTYTNSWDSLIHFLENDTLYITERNEEVFPQDYGVDSVVITIDTIGTITAYDSIIVNRLDVPTLIQGTVDEIPVNEGDQVDKGDVIVRMSSKGKSFEVTAPYDGTISRIYVNPGEELNQQDYVAMLSYSRISDIDNLPYIPPSNKNKFELFADKITKNEVEVDVFEVKDVDPIDPKRRDPNFPREPLRVGSRTEVSTSGNW